MQHQKYNRRLFEERLQAFVNNDGEDDQRLGWFEGDLSFFDNYIIPLVALEFQDMST